MSAISSIEIESIAALRKNWKVRSMKSEVTNELAVLVRVVDTAEDFGHLAPAFVAS